MGKQWIALIPAYEPEDFLPALLKAVEEAGFEAVVVDDGSGAVYGDTFRLASGYATVLTHMTNQGKGQALKTGMRYIQEQFGEDCIVVTMDADGQHKVLDAIRLCRYAEEHPGVLVLGSRQFSGEVPLRSRLGNEITRLVYRLSTGVSVRDTQTGLRAFWGDMIPELLAVEGSRYEYEMNMLLDFAQKQKPMKELIIDTVYINGNAGSHFNTLTDSCRIYQEILKFSASSFLGFLIDYALYGLLLLATGGMATAVSLRISNVGARIVSAAFNYTVNRNVVFRSHSSIPRSALKYFLLAGGILALNTMILTFLVQQLGIPALAAKVLTELVLFLFSWVLQRRVVFREGVSVC